MRILFICTGNCFRSPVAALTKKYKPDWKVDSPGISPGGKIAEAARNFLEGEGAFQYLKLGPEALTERALEDVDLAVVMEKKHKKHLLENFQTRDVKIIVWGVDDPIYPDVDPKESFESIKSRVKNL